MSHLSAERLAALADASPSTAEEVAHLASCASCAREREAHRRVAVLAADERTRLAPPLTNWSSLSAALRVEGLLSDSWSAASAPEQDAGAGDRTTPAPARTSAARRPVGARVRRWGLRAAAGLLVAAGGVAAGRVSAGAAPVPGFATAPTARGVALDVAANVLDTVRQVGNFVADTTAVFRSTTEALVALARAEQQYQLAAAFLLDHDSSAAAGAGPSDRTRLVADSSSVYRARLVALDNVMAASRQALYEAPHDPLINRYYLATLASREATLRQLNTVLPAGTQLTRY